jgi:hypothetical protein
MILSYIAYIIKTTQCIMLQLNLIATCYLNQYNIIPIIYTMKQINCYFIFILNILFIFIIGYNIFYYQKEGFKIGKKITKAVNKTVDKTTEQTKQLAEESKRLAEEAAAESKRLAEEAAAEAKRLAEQLSIQNTLGKLIEPIENLKNTITDTMKFFKEF